MDRFHRVKKVEGSFTVFFAMAFLSILVFYFVLMYTANHCIAVTQGRKMVDSAGRSALSEYDRKLERKYGIYAVCKMTQVREDFEYYLRKNAESSRGAALFPYKLGAVRLEARGNLSEIAILANQIKQFMQERILADLFDQITESLGILQSSIKTVEDTVTNLDQVQKYNELYLQLVEKVDGIRSDGTAVGKGINRFPESKRFNLLYEKMEETAKEKEITAFRQTAEEWRKEIQRTDQDHSEVEQLLVQIRKTGSTLAKEILPITPDKISDYINYIQKIKDKLGMLKSGLEAWEEEPYGDYMGEQVKKIMKEVQEETKEIILEYTVNEGEKINIDIKALWGKITGGEQKEIWDCAPDRERLDMRDPVYFQLPSKIYDRTEEPEEEEEFEDILAEILDKFKKIGSVMLEKFYITEYAGGMLQSFPEAIKQQEGLGSFNLRREAKEAGFFMNELEYLIRGSFNEYKNVRSVQRRIMGIRTVLNMISIFNDQTKTQLIKDLADSVGGLTSSKAGQIITYTVLWMGWSLWEAKEDWDVLVEGRNVPLLKSKGEWRTSLEGLFEEAAEDINVENESRRGLSYQQYAKLLLYLSSNETIERRIQDLIFLESNGMIPLQWYLTGFSVEGDIQAGGRNYAFSGTYQY